MPSEPLFAFERVEVAFGGHRVLKGVDASVADRGGVTVLQGPSGSGKSTMLRLCNRLEVPTAGVVRFRGQDLAGLDVLAHRREVGMVFQRPTLFPGTVRDNLRVARPDGDDATFRTALERANLRGSFLDRVGDELTGGEAQRACLARTLVTEPAVLLMDEPTSALDPSATRGLEALAADLAAQGMPVLWVSHDLAQAERIGDDRIILVDGRVAGEHSLGHYLASEDPEHHHHDDGERHDGYDDEEAR